MTKLDYEDVEVLRWVAKQLIERYGENRDAEIVVVLRSIIRKLEAQVMA
jgi:hypothetical protein